MNETDTLLSIDVRSDLWRHATVEAKLSDPKISCNNCSLISKIEKQKCSREREGVVIWSPCNFPYYNKCVQHRFKSVSFNNSINLLNLCVYILVSEEYIYILKCVGMY